MEHTVNMANLCGSPGHLCKERGPKSANISPSGLENPWFRMVAIDTYGFWGGGAIHLLTGRERAGPHLPVGSGQPWLKWPVKTNPPGIGPQILVYKSINQG